MQPLDTAAAKMQSSSFGASRSLRDTLASDCVGAFDGLGASLFLTSNPAIQVPTPPLPVSGRGVAGKQVSFVALCQLILTVTVMVPSLQYTVFEQIKQRMLQRRLSKTVVESAVAEIGPGPSLTMLAAFLLGALSKTVATILTYPAIRLAVPGSRTRWNQVACLCFLAPPDAVLLVR